MRSVNDLLSDLGIPISIQTPQQLAPTLLIAILESILQQRIPLSLAARECSTRTGRIEAMKVLLGILGNDLLQHDLTIIDPQKLADGELKETRLICHLLSELYQNTQLQEYTLGCGHSYSMPRTSACEAGFVSGPVGGQTVDDQMASIAHPSLEEGSHNQKSFVSLSNVENDSFAASLPQGSSVRQDGWMERADERCVEDLTRMTSTSNRSWLEKNPIDDTRSVGLDSHHHDIRILTGDDSQPSQIGQHSPWESLNEHCIFCRNGLACW